MAGHQSLSNKEQTLSPPRCNNVFLFVLVTTLLCALPFYIKTLRSLDRNNISMVRKQQTAAASDVEEDVNSSAFHSEKRASPVSSSSSITTTFEEDDDIEVRNLLSHVLVTLAYWHYPNNKGEEVKFLGHTLGTIREYRLLPQVGNVTVVIVTNDADGAKKEIGNVNDGWYTYHQVDVDDDLPFHMPFYHREVVAVYIDRQKDGMNMTVMPNKDLPSPTAYSFMETDNVINGAGLLAWAKDTVFLNKHGGAGATTAIPDHQHIRHFWRWEYNKDRNCPVFIGQQFQLSRNDSDRLRTIGGRRFISMTGAGVWAGMYVITAQHMLNYYQSGSFWNLSNTKYKWSREVQLHDIIHHGSNITGKPGRKDGDNTLIPFDERTGTADLVAAVHHQSDKYVKGHFFGKLCVNDLFTDE